MRTLLSLCAARAATATTSAIFGLATLNKGVSGIVGRICNPIFDEVT
jgi:hypothetical protein